MDVLKLVLLVVVGVPVAVVAGMFLIVTIAGLAVRAGERRAPFVWLPDALDWWDDFVTGDRAARKRRERERRKGDV